MHRKLLALVTAICLLAVPAAGCSNTSAQRYPNDPVGLIHGGSVPSDASSLCELERHATVPGVEVGLRILGQYRADGSHFSFFLDACGVGLDVAGFGETPNVLAFLQERANTCAARGSGSSYICVVHVLMDATVNVFRADQGLSMRIAEIHDYLIQE